MTIITALAGSISSIFSNPIWMINTRLAIQKKQSNNNGGAVKLIAEITKNEGVGAFFKGVLPNLILVLNPIINFVVYENIKKFAIKKYGSERKIPFSAIFYMSSIGKIMATLVTYPILTIRVKLQAGKDSDGSGAQKIKSQIKELGIKGLYHGLEAKLVQTVLYNAFLMMTYEKLRTFIKLMIFRAFF